MFLKHKESEERYSNSVKNREPIRPNKFYDYKDDELILNYDKHSIDFNLFKICMYLTENNFYYADLLLEKYNIVELYTKYLYKLAVNYKN